MKIKFNTNKRMGEILTIVDPLEDELFDLRCNIKSYPYESPERDKIRLLRKNIGKLMLEYWDISLELNKEYHAIQPIWKKKFV